VRWAINKLLMIKNHQPLLPPLVPELSELLPDDEEELEDELLDEDEELDEELLDADDELLDEEMSSILRTRMELSTPI